MLEGVAISVIIDHRSRQVFFANKEVGAFRFGFKPRNNGMTIHVTMSGVPDTEEGRAYESLMKEFALRDIRCTYMTQALTSEAMDGIWLHGTEHDGVSSKLVECTLISSAVGNHVTRQVGPFSLDACHVACGDAQACIGVSVSPRDILPASLIVHEACGSFSETSCVAPDYHEICRLQAFGSDESQCVRIIQSSAMGVEYWMEARGIRH